jgi:hypothetical protein
VFHDDQTQDYGQVLAAQGSQLAAVRVHRIPGEAPNDCPGR